MRVFLAGLITFVVLIGAFGAVLSFDGADAEFDKWWVPYAYVAVAFGGIGFLILVVFGLSEMWKWAT